MSSFVRMLVFTFCLADCFALEVGVNMISVGNEYANPEFQDEKILPFLAMLKSEGFERVSFRVTWSRMEVTEGVYNEAYIKNLRRLYHAAEKAGLKALLDFHTLFKRQVYACPAWVSNYTDVRTGGPGVHSVIMTVRHPAVGKRYIDMQRHVAKALAGCGAIDSVSVMNEPFTLEWAKPDAMRAEQAALTTYLCRAARELKETVPRWKTTVRFCMPYSPWALDDTKRFGIEELMGALDIFSLNNYLDPANPADTRPLKGTPSGSWVTFAETARRCHAAGKGFWVTEFGCPVDGEVNDEGSGMKVPPGGQARYYDAFFARLYAMEYQPQSALAWVMSLGAAGRSLDSYALWDRVSASFTDGGKALVRHANVGGK